MTDSFFDFSNLTTHDKTFEEDDDAEYDALNSETFGEDLPATDWEEVHEQLASELEKCNFEDENNELCERVASSILDDEIDDVSNAGSRSHPPQHSTPQPSPGKWWPNGVSANTGEQPSQKTQTLESWWQRPPSTPLTTVDPIRLPPKKILTVEELEESLKQKAVNTLGVRSNRPHGSGHGPTPRPEEFDRDMQHIPHTLQNGNYVRGRGGMPGRGRYRPDLPQEHQPYHAVLHPYPPYPGGHNMIRPPLRHPGPMYPRHPYDGRGMLPPGAGQNRHPRPRPEYPNQHQAYGRVGPSQPADEYAGLMSPQEKQWLASIQMMQLNTTQPYQDDYYYLMYQQRQGSAGRKMCSNHNQKREQLPQKPASTYTPLQFENSLGKLQIGSVTAPRKIIDMELVESLDHNTKQSDRKSKQILLEIEEIYNYVILIEDAFNPLNTSKQDLDIVNIQEKLLSMVTPDGKLVQIMAIRKGKKAILRMLPNLLFPAGLLHRLMVDLVPITRKDTENNMLLFLPAIRIYLQGVSLDTLVEITTNYDNQFLLSNKFTVSVMANLIERADQVRGECTDERVLNEWNMFLLRLLESTRLWNTTERPVVAVDRNVLLQHLAPVVDQVSQAELNALLNTLQPSSYAAPAAPAPAASEAYKI